MEFIFHNSFDRSCRLNSALSQRYRIPNSRESQDQDQKTWTNLYRNSPYRGSGIWNTVTLWKGWIQTTRSIESVVKNKLHTPNLYWQNWSRLFCLVESWPLVSYLNVKKWRRKSCFSCFLYFKFFMVYWRFLNVAQRKHTKQTIRSFIAWISTEFSYMSLPFRLLRQYSPNIVIFRYFIVYCVNIHRI